MMQKWLFPRLLLAIASIMLFLAAFSAPVSALVLTDTGQQKCYDNGGVIISCPLPDAPFAQDGSYTGNPRAFLNNGDGSITDINTGLSWQQQDNGLKYNWYQAAGIFHSGYNSSSTNVCAALTTGGFTDWRLPSKKELLTISDYGNTPSLDPLYFPNLKSYYWTSTGYAADTTQALLVYADAGSPMNLPKNYSLGASVRCVRGEPLVFGDYVDNTDGTVIDRATGLTWQKGESSLLHWDQALDYCEGLILAGAADWRLPNLREMETILDDSRSMPSLNTNFFSGPYGYIYWTSTTYAPGNYFQYAWDLAMLNGNYQGGGKSLNTQAAKCVRGGLLRKLSVTEPVGGTITSEDGAVDCPTACNATYGEGTAAILNALASPGYVFRGWGGDCTGSGACLLNMSADKSVSAVFEADADGDGYPVSQDCDDLNAAVHPGAPEIKGDGIDQDCNGYDLTIAITKATYSRSKKTLTVEATSALRSAASLYLVGYKPMTWVAFKSSRWTATVTGVTMNPGSVTVSGVEGNVSAPTIVIK